MIIIVMTMILKDALYCLQAAHCVNYEELAHIAHKRYVRQHKNLNSTIMPLVSL